MCGLAPPARLGRHGKRARARRRARPRRSDLADVGPDEVTPMQIKYEFEVKHTGTEADEPFRFQLAATPHFATRDQSSNNHAPFVRALGLGAKNTFDYSTDPRQARLSYVDTDYLQYGQRRIETVVINAADAEVKFCPGDRTHFELLQREGFKDAIAYHSGPMAPGEREFWKFYACLGAGRVALPKTLKPGESWRAEYVVRRHERYWDAPMWDRTSAQPPPPWLPPAAGDDGDDEGEMLTDIEAGGSGGAFGGEGGGDGGWSNA
ncbi:MAG: hypothetical protein J3K34DRAFT_440717 [Monoraphidium minutum]|nr:MAG: hypothetical protein J3K34DRAFT_440717 [Monoraphidium minutum]